MKYLFLSFLLIFSLVLRAQEEEYSANPDTVIAKMFCSNITFSDRYKAIELYKKYILNDSSYFEISLMIMAVLLQDNDPRINGLAKSIIQKYKSTDSTSDFTILFKSLLIYPKINQANNHVQIEKALLQLKISNLYLLEYFKNPNKNDYLITRKIKNNIMIHYCK